MLTALASTTPTRNAPNVVPSRDARGDRDDDREYDLELEFDVDAECVSHSHAMQLLLSHLMLRANSADGKKRSFLTVRWNDLPQIIVPCVKC